MGQPHELHTSELEDRPIATLYVCCGIIGLSNSMYIDTELTFDLDNFRLGAFHFFIRTVALPDLCFHWPK